MKQRVKLAQALVHDPQLVLLDEPTNGLDPAGRDEMLAPDPPHRHRVRHLGLVTSHLLGELERVCDHLVVDRRRQAAALRSTGDFTERTGVARGRGRRTAADRSSRRALRGARARRPSHDGRDRARRHSTGDETYDVVRDAVADLGLAWSGMEQRRHRLEDLFSDDQRRGRRGMTGRQAGRGRQTSTRPPPPGPTAASTTSATALRRPPAGPRIRRRSLFCTACGRLRPRPRRQAKVLPFVLSAWRCCRP